MGWARPRTGVTGLAILAVGCSSPFAPLPELPNVGTLVFYAPPTGAQPASFTAVALPADDKVFHATSSAGSDAIQLLVYPDGIGAFDLEVGSDGRLSPDVAGLGLPPAPQVFKLVGTTLIAVPEALPSVKDARFRAAPCAPLTRHTVLVGALEVNEHLSLITPWGGGVVVGTSTSSGVGGRAWTVDRGGAHRIPLQSSFAQGWVGGRGALGTAVILGKGEAVYSISRTGTVSRIASAMALAQTTPLLNITQSDKGNIAFLDDQGQAIAMDPDGTPHALGRLLDNLSNCLFSATTDDRAIFEFNGAGDLLAMYHSGRFDILADNGLWTSFPLPDSDACSAGRAHEGPSDQALISYGLANAAVTKVAVRREASWEPMLEAGDLAPAQLGRIQSRAFVATTVGEIDEIRHRLTSTESSYRRCAVAAIGFPLAALYDGYGGLMAVYQDASHQLLVDILTAE